jgi:hypothetical protein
LASAMRLTMANRSNVERARRRRVGRRATALRQCRAKHQ